jgi:hypothetical protein
LIEKKKGVNSDSSFRNHVKTLIPQFSFVATVFLLFTTPHGYVLHAQQLRQTF